MIRFETFVCVMGITGVLTTNVIAQYPGVGGGTGVGSAVASANSFRNNYHVGFDRPEAWGLKYFASSSLLSGLQPPEPSEGHRTGSITIGFEVGWLPTLDDGQRRIGFNGKKTEDLNKAPIFARPVVRVGLPDKFSLLLAAPPPFEVFGGKSRLFAFGLERPLLERDRLTISWRGYGQVGSVKGAFTCPHNVLAYAPGS